MTKCATCEHQAGEQKCHQTDRGLTAGWPKSGGMWSPNNSVKFVALPCPRYSEVQTVQEAD